MPELTKVLLVDDNSKYLKDALPFYGYEVTTAHDGVQALKELFDNNKNFDIVLLDVMMPNMNGWQTLKEIRSNENTKHLPVIMLTAVNEEEKMVAGLKIGADDYIVKPFILPNLLARMEAVLRRSKWQSVSVKQSPKKDLPPDLLTSKEKDTQRSFEKYCDIKNSEGIGAMEQGRACTAWVIYNGNMDYLHCNDLSWHGKTKCK